MYCKKCLFFVSENLIRGLDDDEVDFLEFVDRTKMTVEKKKLIEEKKRTG